jgi:hypothetical protein
LSAHLAHDVAAAERDRHTVELEVGHARGL